VQQVRQQGGDYLLVKRNQSLLHSEIADLFAAPLPRWLEHRTAHTSHKAHARREVRAICASTELAEWLAPRWPDVAQFFQIERRITQHGTTRHKLVYGFQLATPGCRGAAPAGSRTPTLVYREQGALAT
jgi:hypothetical protein